MENVEPQISEVDDRVEWIMDLVDCYTDQYVNDVANGTVPTSTDDRASQLAFIRKRPSCNGLLEPDHSDDDENYDDVDDDEDEDGNDGDYGGGGITELESLLAVVDLQERRHRGPTDDCLLDSDTAIASGVRSADPGPTVPLDLNPSALAGGPEPQGQRVKKRPWNLFRRSSPKGRNNPTTSTTVPGTSRGRVTKVKHIQVRYKKK